MKAMKINNFNSVNHHNPYKKQQNEPAEQSKKPMQKDEINISSEAKNLQSALKSEAERKAKIDEIKKQIENGTYNVKPEKTAKSFLDFWFKK
ncbi:flagellar biosynthesis anti-sigma factor FlgM [Fictibacillus iocasae]|uniref:Negative regulator of flagellin synthesis n=1 Tax=Fictibacillus iocasae TaxID=2715437 RepID=A0ABW2NUV8_9BACL